jgi:hypothetical protein
MDEKNEIIPALIWILDILNKYSVNYQITGGFAASLYGSPRAVNDIDIDIPDYSFSQLQKELNDFIIFGPGRINDGIFDLLLTTLDYNGQKIDLSGGDSAKIYDSVAGSWRIDRADFKKFSNIRFEGLDLKVIQAEDLIEYKSIIGGIKNQIDIEYCKKYIENNA